MIMSRKEWKEKVEDDLLTAFCEYMCRRIADIYNINIYRANILDHIEMVEVTKAINRVLTNTVYVKKAIEEIMTEVKPVLQVNLAKNHVAHYYPARKTEILLHEFDADIEFANFMKKYIKLP